MIEKKGFLRRRTLILLTLSVLLGAIPLHAAATCKGLGSSACQKDSNCTWVKDYVRKDGAKVTGHCKSKPKSSGAAADKKKSDGKKKSTDKSKSDSKKKSTGKSESDSKKKSTGKSKSDGKK